jgi:hypothetical protein
MLMLFTGIVFFYNVFCIYVTFLLDSIWHAILDNFRPVCLSSQLQLLFLFIIVLLTSVRLHCCAQVSVWTIDLLLFYIFTDGAFGEAW